MISPTVALAMANDLIETTGPWRAGLALTPEVFVGPDSPRTDARAQAYFDVVKHTCGFTTPPRVLDLGAMVGSLSLPFAAAGSAVTAVEGRETNCAKIRLLSRCREFDPAIEVLCARLPDALGTAQLQRQYDVVIMAGLLYHLPVQAAARLLDACRCHWRPKLLIVDTHMGAVTETTEEAFVALNKQEVRVKYLTVPSPPTSADDDSLLPERHRLSEPSLQRMFTAAGARCVLTHSVVWDWLPCANPAKQHGPGLRKVFFVYGLNDVD